jgi:hypothetical protein
LILDVDGRNKNHSNNVFANDTKLLPNVNFLMVTESIDCMHNDVLMHQQLQEEYEVLKISNLKEPQCIGKVYGYYY